MEQKQKEQRDGELIKNTFKDNESLLRSMRKFFYQMPLNAVDLANLTGNFKNKDLIVLIREIFLPKLDSESPLGSQSEVILNIPLKELQPDMAVLHIRAVSLFEKYTEQQLQKLASGDYQEQGTIFLEEMKEIEDCIDRDIFVNTFARNMTIGHVERKLMWLSQRANEKEKTPEDIEKDKKANSSK